MANTRPRSGKNRPANPLERSSYEFMAALVFASVTQLIPNWLAYLVCWIAIAAISVYFCWFSQGTVGYGPKRKAFLSVLVVVFIVSICYSQVVSRYREANIIPPPVQYLEGWEVSPVGIQGDPPIVIAGSPTARVRADGRLLDKYKDKFELMAVIFHITNDEDPMEKKGLSKSELVKIRPDDLHISIPLNTQYLEEIRNGPALSQFVLLALPSSMKPGDFITLNDAESKGAQIIGKGSTVAAQLPNGAPMPIPH